MKIILSIAALAASCVAFAAPAMAQRASGDVRYSQFSPEDARFNAAQQRFSNEMAIFQNELARYQATRNNQRDRRGYDNRGYNDDRDEGSYDPQTYYRDGPRYQERILTSDERVYRGRDGRYYCKRSDGTTGLIVGAVAGGALGNVIDGGHSRTAGTLLGAIIGGLAGQAIEQNNNQIRCR